MYDDATSSRNNLVEETLAVTLTPWKRQVGHGRGLSEWWPVGWYPVFQWNGCLHEFCERADCPGICSMFTIPVSNTDWLWIAVGAGNKKHLYMYRAWDLGFDYAGVVSAHPISFRTEISNLALASSADGTTVLWDSCDAKVRRVTDRHGRHFMCTPASTEKRNQLPRFGAVSYTHLTLPTSDLV